MVQGRTYIVVVDAIVGRGNVFRRGQVLAEEDLWGMALVLEEYGAVVPNSDVVNRSGSGHYMDPPVNHYML